MGQEQFVAILNTGEQSIVFSDEMVKRCEQCKIPLDKHGNMTAKEAHEISCRLSLEIDMRERMGELTADELSLMQFMRRWATRFDVYEVSKE